MQFSSPNTSKMDLSETDFSDTVTIHNDQISHVKHVLAPLYVFFTARARVHAQLQRQGQHDRLGDEIETLDVATRPWGRRAMRMTPR